jgi:phosphodiesterase/alkaline phosphatase D-like protein
MMKLAAASCAKIQDIEQPPAWAEIQQERPDVLLLLGDNIYLQRDRHDDPAQLAAELRHLYAQQFGEPGFAALLADVRARGGHVVAIYDDHDFLGNNRYGGDHGTALCNAARQEFVTAFAPPLTGGDVYRALTVGPVDIVVLDERFYRRAPANSANDRDAVLGAAQWNWLEGVLAASKSKYLVIGSSTTLHTFGDESWEQYPAAFQRISQLLRGRRGALVVSGDVHRNACYDDNGVIEIVTSAVARRGLSFGAVRKNYGIFTFGLDAVRIELRSLKVGWRFDFNIPLADWLLP